MSIKITRIAGLKLKAEVEGFEIISGQIDDHSTPEGPSPSKLMVASLGLCTGLYAAWYLKRHNIPDEGLTVDVETIDASSPNRVGVFNVKVNVKADLNEEAEAGLISSITRCYVGNTLKGNPEINYKVNVERS
jgi:uncharacterized OsmC-like protein